MKIVFHPEAREELLESARFFEEKTPGLGWDLIARFPGLGPIEHGNVRKCLVRDSRLPYFTKVNPNHIFIAAVMHQHRRPGYWAERLE